jgi:predicted alpha/beta hydrolase family esterase
MQHFTKVILIPGNGGAKPTDGWFPYVQSWLTSLNFEVINKEFPDPLLARQEFWLPFIKGLGADENTILIGHSSGAEAAMRYVEKNKVLGSVLVGACYTDLGEENEKQSGYYDRPWDWQAIKNNQQWVVQFASTDDPFIPIEEARYVNKKLQTEYFEYTDKGHFMATTFPELIEAIKSKIGKSVAVGEYEDYTKS